MSLSAVREFWRRMNTNRFADVAELLAPDFLLDWPQSNERIRGAASFVAVNSEYPAHGPWRFTINRIVAAEDDAVSDVSVTDGVQHARAITFFTFERGKIGRIVEFWPEPFVPATRREHLVEPIE